MQLYLVRHTTLDVAEGICYGQSDIDVANSFDDELEVLKMKLAHLPPCVVYSSPLQRCAKLALGLNMGAVIEDRRLMELSFGDWELCQWDSIARPTFDAWADNYAHLSPPNGETFSQLHARTKHFLEQIRHESAHKTVVIVTHGGVIRAMLAEVLNMPLKGLFRFQVDYASVTQLDFSSDIPRIGYVNR